MFLNLPAEPPIRASTQDFLDIEDIQDDLVILKTGACALVLQVTAVNFGLLSEGEQDALIYAHAGLLNSLSFPIEIVIRSKRKDISSYLRLLKDQEARLKKPVLVEQMRKYREFVETTVRENQVLDKKFYVSIPFSTLEMGIAPTLSQTFKPQKGLPFSKPHILVQAKTNLAPKRDHLMRQFQRLGLKCRQLTTQELLQLFYSLHNPESIGQNFASSKDYASPLVQAATIELQTAPAMQGTKKEVQMDSPIKDTKPVGNKPPGEAPAGAAGRPQAPTASPGPGMPSAVGPTPGAPSTPPPISRPPSPSPGAMPTGPGSPPLGSPTPGVSPAQTPTGQVGPQGPQEEPQETIDSAAEQITTKPSPTTTPGAPESTGEDTGLKTGNE